MMEGAVQCSGNYIPLTPISFLERAASVYGDEISIICSTSRYSWRETHKRCLKLASTLSLMGISRGDMVAALAPNIPALYELHFAVPMAGAVLSALNPNLDSPTLSLLLQQSEPKIIFMDHEVLPTFLETQIDSINPPLIVLISYPSDQSPPPSPPPGSFDYNGFLQMGNPNFDPIRPNSELDPISVNFTSGSTGTPKGVVYSHRAAYLNSLAQIFRCNMRRSPPPVFLWTVDMFRCNGWCFPWAMAALGGANVCVRRVTAEAIFDAVSTHGVTNFCGAPALLDLIAEAPARDKNPLRQIVDVFVAGALPPPQILEKIKELDFNLTHGYGMTESLGPATATSLWESGDDSSPADDRREANRRRRREGIHNILMEAADVKDPVTMQSVPCDGNTIGEIMFRGNCLMTGYLRKSEATEEAFKGGWFRTGDLGVKHSDGVVEMKDRVKDAIVCGGKRVSSLEIEAVLVRHPDVQRASVVGRADDELGETPCAFVELKEGRGGCEASAEEIMEFCKDQLEEGFEPRTVVFGDLPVNSTGKIQKFVLRERAKVLGNPQ